jgi:hypothetical protein
MAASVAWLGGAAAIPRRHSWHPCEASKLMASAVAELVALVDEVDPYTYPAEDIAGLQLQAAQERLEERCAQIEVLDRRARDADIGKITCFDDLLPLLFSHTTYKSYPQSFLRAGRWEKLLAWYSTLASTPTDNVDLSGITTIDEWLDALWRGGHRVAASSGTTGKSSFIPATNADRDLVARILRGHMFWPEPVPDVRLRWYQLSPKYGPFRFIDTPRALAELMASHVQFLTERPMLLSELMRGAELQQAMAEGTANPSDIAQHEAELGARAADFDNGCERLAVDLAEHRDEPVCVFGLWPQHWRMMKALEAMGVSPGSFNPNTMVFGAGGTKGTKLPDDYREQIFAFYGVRHQPRSYGMSEIMPSAPMCEAGRYHQAPWVTLFVLDQAGEKLLERQGQNVVGRAAFLDFAVEGRWGGLVTGDQVSVDFTVCACGRPGPTIADTVRRYTEIEGNDDKLTCAGTIESYIRTIVRED